MRGGHCDGHVRVRVHASPSLSRGRAGVAAAPRRRRLLAFASHGRGPWNRVLATNAQPNFGLSLLAVV
jgi:hypothetical protein